jgi:very-short-patch-repair endonuclease
MPKDSKNTLVAYIPTQNDLKIAKEKHWYRIPVSSQNVPVIVKDGNVKTIAFYQPKSFKNEAHLIRFYADVKSVDIENRRQLFPEEPTNSKSDSEYHVINFGELHELEIPIVSIRKRRILFITTTQKRLLKAREINDLFLESPIEEKVWEEFTKTGINAERQYYISFGSSNFVLDFALFCKNRNLNIECDGDSYHLEEMQVKNDKRRDNLLESTGWNILRYTTDDIVNNFEESIMQVKDTINQYGGLEDIKGNSKYRYFPKPSNEQTLF